MTKSITILSVLIFAMLLCFNALAADWKELDENTYFDASKIKETNNSTLMVWVRLTLDEKERYTQSELTHKDYTNYSHSKQLWEIKCNSNQFRLVSAHDVDSNSTIIDSFEPNNSRYTYVIPDSIGELLLNAACSYVKRNKGNRK